MIRCLNYLRNHRVILSLLGILSICHAAYFWFRDASLFQSYFPSSEFLEETEIVVKFSMEITAGVSWILGVILLGASRLKSSTAKPVVIAAGIGLVTSLPIPLQHNYGNWTTPSVLIVGLVGIWAILAGIFVLEEDTLNKNVASRSRTKKKPITK